MADPGRPLILVTNDDGITAPGVRNLVLEMTQLGEVVVVAPDGPQSGKGHAITIENTLRCDQVHIDDGPQREFACSGTPVDCVKLAVNVILDRKPSLIVSGINHGSNSSINVIYSGTMSAAVEGAMEGIPSVGFSLLDYSWDADFAPVCPYVRAIAQEVLNNGLTKGTCLNVNFPSPKTGPIRGIRICRQADANWVREFDSRTDPRGRKYYWLTGRFENYDRGEDTDEWALSHGYASIVPVQYDVTAHHAIGELNKWGFDV